MVENYMDYSDDGCMNMFSTNQSIVMRAILELARLGLIEGQDGNEDCNLAGDMNTDGILNIQDIILLVNTALGIPSESNCADMNNDGSINIQDIILLVNEVLA